MEVKNFNRAILTKSAYSSQSAQKNQIAFQGLKEKAFKAGVKLSPVGIVDNPFVVASMVTQKALTSLKEAAFKAGVKLSPVGMVDNAFVAASMLTQKVVKSVIKFAKKI
ncbi:MAG: hypothetical protein WCG23_02000 [bacterium]